MILGIPNSKSRLAGKIQPLLKHLDTNLNNDACCLGLIRTKPPAWWHALRVHPRDVLPLLAAGRLWLGITGTDHYEEWRLAHRDVTSIHCLPIPTPQPWKLCLVGTRLHSAEIFITEYPNITQENFPHATITLVSGCCEEWVNIWYTGAVTIVDSGETLRRLGLSILKTLKPVQACWVYDERAERCDPHFTQILTALNERFLL